MSPKGRMNSGIGLTLGVMLMTGSVMAQELDQSQQQGVDEQQQAHETDVQAQGAPQLAKECLDLALQKEDQAGEIKGKSIYETNAKDYKQGEEFELLVDLLGRGNSMYNLTCQIDADGNMTYESTEKSSTAKSSPGGA